MADYAAARRNMVDSQVRTNKVRHYGLIDALATIPREAFVPSALKGVAYLDEDLHLGGDRYLVEPMVLARMIQAVDPKPEETALDVGCATGYSSALLAELVGTVIGIDPNEEFVDMANSQLSDLGYDNATVVASDLPSGYASEAPYEVILVNGMIDEVPSALADQLAEGGRLVAVVSDGRSHVAAAKGLSGGGRVKVFTKAGGVMSGRTVCDAATPVLPGFEREEGFVF
ncbi:MAG: protein-L-isoaspartate O-methyltransferase [Alphaproteobacteria bacterium]|nr:protein-L-isoaspartate O-methyltransferase [Alphaproteobacteria bacterium]